MSKETFTTGTGQTIGYLHDADQCFRPNCPIHNPSDHHMRSWRTHWRPERYMMERICPTHSTGHPDPDDQSADTIHGCCGCCNPDPEKRKAKYGVNPS
jgi:hypothetical protein